MTNDINYGLVCLTKDKSISFKTITKKKFDSLSHIQKTQKLNEIYTKNLETFKKAIEFCNRNDIKMYRMSSNMFPFGDTDLGREIMFNLAGTFEKLGVLINKYGIRVVCHPDQFCVLSSDKEQVRKNSVAILEHHADIFDLLGLSQTTWNLINIHGGKKGGIQQLIESILNLSPRVRNRLTLENCEYSYSPDDLYRVWKATGVPILFDSHHALVMSFKRFDENDYDSSRIRNWFELSRSTWTNPENQVCHISNGKDYYCDRKHSDYISEFPEHLKDCQWVEVEAKAKDDAIKQLRNLA